MVRRRFALRPVLVAITVVVVVNGCSERSVEQATSSATTSSTAAKSNQGSGIQGSVILDGCTRGKACYARPPAPLSGTVEVVTRSSESLVASTRIASTGAFRAAVAPGDYIVRVRAGDSSVHCPETATSVLPASYSTVSVHCTSGA
jgi:hypothetical protein